MTCGTCNGTLIRQGVWLAASLAERAAWKLAGYAVRAAPGKCRACYQRDYRKNLGSRTSGEPSCWMDDEEPGSDGPASASGQL